MDGDTTPSIDYNRQTITDGGASHVINHFDQSVKSALKTNKVSIIWSIEHWARSFEGDEMSQLSDEKKIRRFC